MADSHSFTEYVAKTFDNQFWAAAEEYLRENMDDLNIELYKVHRAGETEIQDLNVEHVWVEDLPEMAIQFDVALSVVFEIHEEDYHYDDTEEKKIWMMVRCRGDLAQDLADFKIFEVSDYNGKNRAKKPMDDALVPVIYKDNLEQVAEQFLRDHYKKALLEPIWVDPLELARSMDLNVRFVNITKEGSIFGRSYFHEHDTELYDPETDKPIPERIPAKTILVDKAVAFMYVLGATNNTIIHECVHWDKHQKAFALARLYNKDLTNIGCRVEGGVVGNKAEWNAVDWMEWQANALTPKIQMPLTMFKKRVETLISTYRKSLGVYDMIDIIEPIIDQLVLDFGVSRTAAKIRMLDAGYEEALGAFTYIDGRYVKPHKATKGFLKPNQTFSISTYDLAIMKFSSAELRDTLDKGRYIYVDSHLVVDSNLYVEPDEYGNATLTHYARNHMDECCLVFDLSIKSKIHEKYHSECFLNRDKASPVDFNVIFHDGYENANTEKQRKLVAETVLEENRFYSELPTDYTVCLSKAMDWRGVTAVELGERIGLNEATVRRVVSGKTSSINSLILICLGMHLPYKISMHIINNSPTKLLMSNRNHQWYDFALQYLYPKAVDEIKAELAGYGADPL